jgi:hypothetical protein
MVSAVAKYWPAVVAGAWLFYVIVSGDWPDLKQALGAFAIATGVSGSFISAHNSGPKQ